MRTERASRKKCAPLLLRREPTKPITVSLPARDPLDAPEDPLPDYSSDEEDADCFQICVPVGDRSQLHHHVPMDVSLMELSMSGVWRLQSTSEEERNLPQRDQTHPKKETCGRRSSNRGAEEELDL
uniref:Uncharacterized protein n=1 Tax=Knipowitschia caucasica TaxID=637954 RepID=A0AAV2MQB7_KNICA